MSFRVETMWLLSVFHISAVDDFFKGDLPIWMPEDALTGSSNKLQYYRVSLIVVWTIKRSFHIKVIVETKEDVEARKKVKAENAVFYISFKTRCGQDYKCIRRRTTENQSIFRFKASVLCESPIMSFIQMVSTFFIACTFFLCVSARDNELLIPYWVSLI